MKKAEKRIAPLVALAGLMCGCCCVGVAHCNDWDTKCDPDDVDYVIPANDDAIRAVKLIAGKMADAVIEGRQGESMAEAPAQEADEPAEAEAVEE